MAVMVLGVNDINGDGMDDLIIGAYGAAINGNDFAGESYIIFGNVAPEPDLNGSEAGSTLEANLGSHLWQSRVVSLI